MLKSLAVAVVSALLAVGVLAGATAGSTEATGWPCPACRHAQR